MCNRYIPPEIAEIERSWHIGRHNNQNPFSHLVTPRSAGPFLRTIPETDALELVVGQWGLIPWFAESPKLKYSTNNARFEEITAKASFKHSWRDGRRCIIPAVSFDEPCWETGKNVWWRFTRADARLWALAGLWNAWTDRKTGEVFESYTMLTINADSHLLMSRMHKPDPKLPATEQDKRSVIAIEADDLERWLCGSPDEAAMLAKPPATEVISGSALASIS